MDGSWLENFQHSERFENGLKMDSKRILKHYLNLIFSSLLLLLLHNLLLLTYIGGHKCKTITAS